MEDKERKSFVFYTEWAEVLRDCPPEIVAEIIFAVSDYTTQGKEPENLSAVSKMAFRLMKQQIDKDQQRYEETCQRRKESVKKRWNKAQGDTTDTNVSTPIQNDTNDTDNEYEYDNGTLSNESKNKYKDAKASSLPEVSGKAREASQAEATDVSDSGHKGKKSERIDYTGFLACWNKTMAGTNVPEMKSFTDTRRRTLKARIGTYGKETVLAVMRKIPASDFLAGRAKEFRATFDWAFSPTNFQKILEGNYDNEAISRASPGESAWAQRKDAEAKARIAAETAERKRRQAETAARAVSRQEFLRQAELHRKAGDYEQWAASLAADYQARAGQNS